jgi:hypothetical protein
VRWCGAAERLRAVERLRAAREREMESCDCVERKTERQRKGTRERKRTTLFFEVRNSESKKRVYGNII